MQTPLQITFHNLERSEAAEQAVRAKVAWLERFCDRITGGRVVVEAPHRHHEQGNQYRVRIDLTVPDREIIVNREPPRNTACQVLDVALRDAFDSARRQLEEYVRVRRGLVKNHAAAPGATAPP